MPSFQSIQGRYYELFGLQTENGYRRKKQVLAARGDPITCAPVVVQARTSEEDEDEVRRHDNQNTLENRVCSEEERFCFREHFL